MGVGENLRRIRNARKLSQEMLARKSTVSQSAISAIEREEKAPTASTLTLLAKALGCVPSDLLEEKEKELFAVTRASRRGVAVDMAARIAALFLHCVTLTFLLFGTGLLFGISAAGAGDLTAALQSVASYTESSMPVSISTFLLASTAGKAITVFCFGLLLSAFAIFASRSFSPQLAGIGFLTVNWIFYTQIPSYSGWNLLKYLSFFGLLRTDQIWGNYLNLNILGCPVSRSACSLTALGKRNGFLSRLSESPGSI